MKQGINPSFKAVAPQAGKWSPKSSEGDDIWRVVDESCRNGHLLQQQQHHDNRPVSPVWTPRSAQCSPVASRKQFRPVPFQSPQLERKFTRLNDGDSGPQAPPPWEQPGFDKLPPPVHPHHHHHHPPNDSKPASSVRRLAQSFSAPKLNTLGGADGHSEPYSKHSRSYVCPPTRSLEGDPPPVQQQQWADDKYATAPPNRDPVTVNRGGYDPVRDMANYATREIPGVGPVTKEGMPISLRSEAKDHNQSHWYKQVYNTIHKPHGDDGFLTVRYKTRRGGATHKANGYMSEPEGYESDYTYNSDAYSGITPQKPPGSYKMNPGKIEDYQPGQYQEPEKPRSTSTRPARTAYTQGNLSRALKEQGYESDNSFIVRKKGPLVNAPSPEYQKQAYLQVQAGGEPPLQGFRKQLSAQPRDENAAEATAAVAPPPPPVKAMKMHALDDVYNNKYDDDTSRQYVEGNVNIHYKSPIRQEFKGIIPEDELAEQQAEAMRAIYEQERRRKQWQELEDLKNRRHTDNFTASQKSPISVHRFDDFVGVEGSAPKPKITTPPLAKAKALYDFVGQSSRELTFNQGDIITIHRKIDANWYEGEHNAFCGLFPVDYVEIISGAPAPAARAKPTEGLARAKYTFVAQSGIELSLNKGELVALTRQVDENWFEGRIANRKGIIPISYCEVITPIGKRFEHPSSMVTSKREEMFIECAPEREMKTSKTEILHVDTSSEPLMYRAVFKYVPQNPDELELFEGDSVMVLEKCDDGWFVGTSERTGCFGTFPGNYVQRI